VTPPSDESQRALEEFVAAGPSVYRPGLRAMLALARRPRGLALLRRIPPADTAAGAVLALARYEDSELARGLGWDADAVVQRGRELRRSEGRP
jgi:hypothetical protein